MTWNDQMTPEPGERTARLSILGPEHILFYTMRHEITKCSCGETQRTARLWLSYREGKTLTARPLGMSETIYAGIEIRESYIDQSTAACPLCVEKRFATAEKWTKPQNKAQINLKGTMGPTLDKWLADVNIDRGGNVITRHGVAPEGAKSQAKKLTPQLSLAELMAKKPKNSQS